MQEKTKVLASAIQQQFWLLNQLNPDSPAYNIASVFKIRGNLDIGRLETSINEILRRFEVFRSTFVMENDLLFQVINPYEPIRIAVENYNGLQGENESAMRDTRTESALPFDLEKGPLVRCKAFVLAKNEYIFSITMHHCLTDLKSNDIFGELLSSIYNSEHGAGTAYNETVTYAQYSQTQQKWLSSARCHEMLSSWKNMLGDCDESLGLSFDHPRPPFRRFSGHAIEFGISNIALTKIRQLCRDPSLNSFVVLLSAYIAFLHKSSGQDRIVVGVPFANRRKNEIKNVVGCFVNILPIAITINQSMTFLDMLDLTRKAIFEAHRRQEVPLELLVKTISLPTDPSFNPIYQCGFTFKHPMNLSFNALDIEPVFFHQGGSQLDLFANFYESPTGIQGYLEYDSDIMEGNTAQRMCGHFLKLLESALDCPMAKVCNLSMMTNFEQAEIRNWSSSSVAFDRTICIQELFENQVIMRPNEIAAVFEKGSFTFEQLNRCSNAFAWELKMVGVKQGDLVGLCVDRTPEMLIGVLGILKAGAAYVPLDSEIPHERLKFILSDAGISVLSTHSKVLSNYDKIDIPIVLIDKIKEDDSKNKNPLRVTTPENAAYVIFTSGSTGQPKGVLIRHRSVINVLNYLKRTMEFSCNDVWLSVASYTFDVSVPDLFLPIGTGANVVFASKESSRDGKLLSDLIENYKVTVLQATPTTMRILLESGWKGFPNLKVLCAGEPLTEDLVEQLLPKVGILWNEYGPTETTIYSTGYKIDSIKEANYIGSPIDNTMVFVLDKYGNQAPIGVPGELYIGGEGVAIGYLNRPDLTAERFVSAPAAKGETGSLVYRTGDLVRWRPGGILQYLHRIDSQVKIRGFRIELGEIESIIQKSSFVKQCVTSVRNDIAGEKQIVAYIVLKDKTISEDSVVTEIRKRVADNLPIYMHPSFYEIIQDFPKTVSGKIDRKALPKPKVKQYIDCTSQANIYTEEEKRIAEIWSRLLGIQQIPLDLKFFEAGGTSLLSARLAVELQKLYGRRVPVAMVFQYPSIREQAKAFSDKQSRQGAVTPGFASVDHGPQNKREFEDIAVVGMSCRFPGANDIESFWRLLVEGQENITFFDDDKIPVNFDRACRNNKQYIRAKGLLSDTDLFDADFFGLSHQMAEVCDPQIRLFLEHSYKALENSGHVFYPNNDIVGAYAGMGRSLYLRNNILSRPDIIEKVGELQIDLGNEKDFLATRLSHSLNLTGPSISISTACSTSLVAIILACHAIHRKECTIALAGGCEISIPLYRGHLHQEGSIFSCDGHCRPFDAAATGTTFSDGVGVVVLKKLSQALEDHNIIYAVIKGAAINNDGAKKVSYSAPGVDGQVNVIASAQKSADLPAETISYIETHGTATPLGDPIEIDSLTQAFRKATNKTQFCAIGSVKSNIGHTGVAAGVAGFIKTTQMLYNKTLVPSLNFKEPNPGIDFDASPFFVNTKLAPWKTNGAPRRAGVSSFGFGGTNAHVILEEAPPREMSGPSRPFQMLPFSAKTESALSAAILNFKDFLTKNPETSLPDCAYTLQAHRTNYLFRRYIVCRTNQEARATITSEDTSSGNARTFSQRSPSIVFMFPGQGTQYATMGAALYSREPAFRAAFDRCAAALRGAMGEDILDVLFSADPDAFEKLKNTYYAQPALFTVEYALACLWQNWGLKPHALVGHSIGEFVAACVSGIMEVEGAAALVAARARLMSALPPGAMLSVRLPESEILPILPPNLSIAAVNSPVLCVVSGPLDAIEEFKTGREKKGVACRPLHTSHAFHSAMVDPIIPVFNAEVRKIRLSTPTIPIVSTVTGKLLTNNEATDPEYWTRHMRVTVRFSDAIKSSLDSEGASVFLEVGPRATCVALVNQHIRDRTRHHAVASLSDSAEQESEYHELINATGQLWIRGVPIDWGAFYKDERRLQGLLPAYPFDRQRYWIEPASPQAYNAPDNALSPKKNDAQTTTPVDISPFKAPPPAVTVADTIRGMITESMGDVSGPIDGSATFLQMGMDSLFLTQLSQRIKTIFGVSVSMRQLMREYATIGKLADFIAKEAAANGNT